MAANEDLQRLFGECRVEISLRMGISEEGNDDDSMESGDRSDIEKEKRDAAANDSKLSAAEIFQNKPAESTAVAPTPTTASYGDLVLSGDRSLKTATSEQPAANLNRENPYTSTNQSDMTNAEARSQAGKMASVERVNAANPTPGQDLVANPGKTGEAAIDPNTRVSGTTAVGDTKAVPRVGDAGADPNARPAGTTTVGDGKAPAVTDATKVQGSQPAIANPTSDAKVTAPQPGANPPTSDAMQPGQPSGHHRSVVGEVATNLLGVAAQKLEDTASRRLEQATGVRVDVGINPRAETPVNVRLEGHVAVPRVVGDAAEVVRVMRPPDDLARDQRAAEIRFRTADTLEVRVQAGTVLESLRREARTVDQTDPTYVARVQEAYRALIEGRQVIRERPDMLPGDAGRPLQPIDRSPIPVRPGDQMRGPLDDRLEIRRPGEGGLSAQDRGVLAVDLSRLAGINFGDGRTREVFIDILKRVDAGTFKFEQLDPNGHKVFDAVKGFDPNRLEQIKQFFTNEVGGAGRPRLDDATIARRVQEILEGGKDSLAVRRPADATDSATMIPRSATERLVDFMRTNREILGQPLDSQASRAALVELGKIIRDMNKELGLDPTKSGITLKDVLARALEGTAKTAALDAVGKSLDRSSPERMQVVREEALVARLNPAQEAAFRAMLERGAKPETQGILPRAETAVQPAQRAAQIEGRPGEVKPVDARTLADDASRSSVRPDQAGARIELNVKGELAGKPEPTVREPGAKPDAAVTRGTEPTVGVVPTKSADTSGQATDQVRTAGRADTPQKFEDDKKPKKPEESDKDKDQEQKLADMALAAQLAARKAKEEKERAEKEKEKAEEKDKKEPERRQKYVVKERDTLESIAGKILRDTRLAALILEINKNTIPIRTENGKQVVNLRPEMVIWLPTTTDIRNFRGRLMTAMPLPSSPEQGSAQDSVPHTWGQELTPEEELAARFGGSVEDYVDKPSDQSSEAAAAAASGESAAGECVENMTLDAIGAAKARRANVESMLGPLTKPKPEDGRLNYTVRLGNTLKSIAISHPALKDVNLWKLLAEVNNLSTETDSQDIPLVRLVRGSTLLLPSPEEIEAYRAEQKG